jgi:hypothetical protein
MSKCEPLAQELQKTRSFFDIHTTNSVSDGSRTVVFSQTWVPGLGTFHNCHGRLATSVEKDLVEKQNKKSSP